MISRIASLVGIFCCAAACGSSDDKTTDTKTSGADTADAGGSPSSTTDNSSSAATTTPTPTPEPTSSGELPGPVLTDVDGQTPLSSLTDDQLAEVCDAYLQTAAVFADSLSGLCDLQGLNAGLAANTQDQATLRSECSAGYDSCSTEAAASDETLSNLSCDSAADCGATVEQFNECNKQIAAVHKYVLVPALGLDVPACNELTVSEAAGLETTIRVQLGLGLVKASAEAGGTPSDQNGPCAELEARCPEFAAPITMLTELVSF